jgi:hypothetical protein
MLLQVPPLRNPEGPLALVLQVGGGGLPISWGGECFAGSCRSIRNHLTPTELDWFVLPTLRLEAHHPPERHDHLDLRPRMRRAGRGRVLADVRRPLTRLGDKPSGSTCHSPPGSRSPGMTKDPRSCLETGAFSFPRMSRHSWWADFMIDTIRAWNWGNSRRWAAVVRGLRGGSRTRRPSSSPTPSRTSPHGGRRRPLRRRSRGRPRKWPCASLRASWSWLCGFSRLMRGPRRCVCWSPCPRTRRSGSGTYPLVSGCPIRPVMYSRSNIRRSGCTWLRLSGL